MIGISKITATVYLALAAQIATCQHQPPPTVIIHLSDIHISTNTQKYWNLFGDREGDWGLLSKSLLPRINPAAVLITGDLTDSKDKHGVGLQQEEEYQRYFNNIVKPLVDGGELSLDQIVDVRGNHDGFNKGAERGSALDYFTQYTASGMRGDATKRAWTHVVLPSTSSSPSLMMPLSQWIKEIVETGKHQCPAAFMLGLDFSEEPALKNPLNFLGHSDEDMIEEIDQELTLINTHWTYYCSRITNNNSKSLPPPIVSYGHYPLSSVDHHHRRSYYSSSILGFITSNLYHAVFGSTHSMQGTAAVLANASVGSYLSGHLHTVFGERLHRAHPLIGDQNDAKNGSKVLAELESGAWKDDRRVRICAIDGGGFSFIDLYMHTPSSMLNKRYVKRSDADQVADPLWQHLYQQRGFGVTYTEGASSFSSLQKENKSAIYDHAVLLTWPIDARYSPQPAVDPSAHPRGTVRALVVDLSGSGGGSETATIIEKVEIKGYIPESGSIVIQDELIKAESDNKDSLGSPVLYSGIPTAVVLDICSSKEQQQSEICMEIKNSRFVHVQISVYSSSSSSSLEDEPIKKKINHSPMIPVALKCDFNDAQISCCLESATSPAPLNLSFLEWFVLLVNWPVLIHIIYLTSIAALFFVFLLLPRYLSTNKALFRRIILSQRRNNTSLMDRVLWPFSALVLFACVTPAWLSMVFYCFYLVLGPLYFTYLLDGPCTLAAVFSYGIYGNFSSSSSMDDGYTFLPTADTILESTMHMAVCVYPLTLWLACVVGSHVVGAAEQEKQHISPLLRENKKLSLFSFEQIVALILLISTNYVVIYHKLSLFLGPFVVLLSPGMAWSIPMAVGVVVMVVRGEKSAMRLRQCIAAKKE